MGLQSWQVQSSLPDERHHRMRFVGGSAAVTALFGTGGGMTIAYVSTGVVDITWREAPGKFAGVVGFGFEADTQSGLKGWTVVAGAPTANPGTGPVTIRLNITNNSDSLADLSASQRLSITFAWAVTS